MTTIKIYTRKQYYTNRYGIKEYLNGTQDDEVLINAAILTGKGLDSEQELIYAAYGETKTEAEKSIELYLKATPNHPVIDKKEISES